uniref:RXLR effector n=1 Tax=Hyaloperonospora arabidopsidis TaxID=272952 RepID=F6MF08_HYAAB|nr:RXLR effector [Hyaloperonospora arabidopsidis]
MRLSAILPLIVAPLHLCVGEVVLIPATMENPLLRSASSAGAGARNDGRSLRELNSAAGIGGEMSKVVSEFGGHFKGTTGTSESVASKKAKDAAMRAADDDEGPIFATKEDLADVLAVGKDKPARKKKARPGK